MKYVMILSEDDSIIHSFKVILKDYFVENVRPSEIISKIKERKPFLIFLDTYLNKVSPLEIIDKIISEDREIFIVPLISSYDKDTREILEKKVFDIIEKSFLIEKIHYVVKKAERFKELFDEGRIIENRKVEEKEYFKDDFKNNFFQMVLQSIAENFLDVKKICYEILKILRRCFHFNYLAIFLKEDEFFKIYSSFGLDEQISREIKLGYESSIIRWFLERGKILSIKEEKTSIEFISFASLVKCSLVFPLRTFDGKLVGLLTIGEKDINEDIKKEEIHLLSIFSDYLAIVFDNFFLYKEIRYQKNYQEFLFKNLPAGIIGVNAEGKINILNEYGEEILKVKFKDINGEKIEKVGSQIADIIRRALDYGETISRKEIEFIPNKKMIGISTNIIKDESNNTIGVVAIFQDLTEVKEIERREKEIEKNKFWGLLASRLSHELKNPLVAINTFAQMMPKMYEDKEFREDFSKIVVNEIRKINEIIDNINKIGEEIDLKKEVLNFDDLIEKLGLERHGKKFKGKVEVDVLKLKLAFDNIMDFVKEDIKDTGKFSIDIEEKINEVIIIINENGKNLTLEKNGNIFIPFNLNITLSTKILIAEKIIESHEGTLQIEITPSSKSFIIKLPFKNEENHCY
ncbi:MAG: PAS domain-containing protein [Candidatus Omnitrophica bacterium]|nr:PAS domain-containing protein [Candidatus Omnitrophota bacterium]